MPTPPNRGSDLRRQDPAPNAAATASAAMARELHPRLAEVLRRVQAAERNAVGRDRRPTFRLMRELLGAAVSLGVSTHALSRCLGTTPGAVSVRARSSVGMTIPDYLVVQLTDLTPNQLDSISQHHLAASHGGRHPSAVDLVRALLAMPMIEPTAQNVALSRNLPSE